LASATSLANIVALTAAVTGSAVILSHEGTARD
jgi:hypothetical protein